MSNPTKKLKFDGLDVNFLNSFLVAYGEKINKIEDVSNLDCYVWYYITNYLELPDFFIEKYKNKLHWESLSKENLSDDFVEKYANYLNWHIISCKKLTESFIEKYANRLDLYCVFQHSQVSESFIEKNLTKIIKSGSLLYVLIFQKGLTEKFFRKHYEHLKNNNYELLQYHQLSESFIEEFIVNADFPSKWSLISINQSISEKFIEKYKKKLNWGFILSKQNLSEEFLEKHINKIDWVGISQNNNTPESFIEKYQNNFNWYFISERESFSENFIRKFYNLLNLPFIFNNHKLDINFKNEISKNYVKNLKLGDRVPFYISISPLGISRIVKKCEINGENVTFYILSNTNNLDCFAVITQHSNCVIFKGSNLDYANQKEMNDYLDGFLKNYIKEKRNNIKCFNDWADSAPENVIFELKHYTASGYRSIKEKDKAGLMEWFNDHIKKIPEFKTRGNVFYRGMIVDKDFLKDKSPGTVFEVDCITSVSSSKNVAKNFSRPGSVLMKMRCKNVKHIAYNDGEKEGLLLKGTKLLIKDVKKRKSYIEMVMEECN